MAHRSGYTLIELLVVITIIMLLTGWSVAGYVKLNQKQTVIAGGKLVMGVLRQAQQRAAAGQKPPVGCTTLQSYSFAAPMGGSTYRVFAQCSDATYAISSGQLGSGLTFGSNINIVFGVLGGGVSGTIGNIQISSSTNTYTFSVSGSGDISEVSVQ